MSAPAIPAGYRRLKVGEKRPKGYKFWWAIGSPRWIPGYSYGVRISEHDLAIRPVYIAPVRKARKAGKGRK